MSIEAVVLKASGPVIGTDAAGALPVRVERRTRPRPLIAHWQRFCGWCGTTNPVATDGRNLTCARCGH